MNTGQIKKLIVWDCKLVRKFKFRFQCFFSIIQIYDGPIYL